MEVGASDHLSFDGRRLLLPSGMSVAETSTDSDVTLSLGGSIPSPGATVMAIGDSITAHGTNAAAGNDGTLPVVLGSLGYLNWACMISGGRLKWAGVSATSGYTSAQILATNLPVALAKKPAACVVLAGTNDVNGAISIQTTAANLKSMYQQLRAAGILPVCCLITPIANSGAQVPRVTLINDWITRYASAHGYPLVDFFSPLVDTSTGAFSAAYTSDGTHPNNAGAKIMGQALSDALSSWLPPYKPWLPGSNTSNDSNLLLANPLMLTDTNADGIPDGWSHSASVGATDALVTETGVTGHMYAVTRGGNDVFPLTGLFSVNPGDTLQISFKASLAMAASGGLVSWRLVTAGNVDIVSYLNWDAPDFAGYTISHEAVVPSGVTQCFVRMDVKTANGTARIGQLGVLNLTQNGLAAL
jgi:lysophospholipase L1-like esterase